MNVSYINVLREKKGKTMKEGINRFKPQTEKTIQLNNFLPEIVQRFKFMLISNGFSNLFYVTYTS